MVAFLSRVFCAFVLSLVVLAPSVQAAGVEALASRLSGIWFVHIEGEKETRTLDVRAVTAGPDGAPVIDAHYATTGTKMSAMNLDSRIVNDRLRVDFATQANNKLALEEVGPGEMVGTFTYTNGRSKPARAYTVRASGAEATERMADRLEGNWIMTFGTDPRTATLDVQRVEAGADGQLKIEAHYGATGEASYPVALVAQHDGARVSLAFTNLNGSRIAAYFTGEESLSGAIVRKNGTTSRVSMQSADTNDLANSRFVLSPKSEVTLLYLGASNCPSCKLFETNSGQGTRKALLASDYMKVIKYREVKTNVYTDTADLHYWPEDLKWVPGKTSAKAGTPRFIVMIDKVVVMNVFGISRLRTQVAPQLELLAAQKVK